MQRRKLALHCVVCPMTLFSQTCHTFCLSTDGDKHLLPSGLPTRATTFWGAPTPILDIGGAVWHRFLSTLPFIFLSQFCGCRSLAARRSACGVCINLTYPLPIVGRFLMALYLVHHTHQPELAPPPTYSAPVVRFSIPSAPRAPQPSLDPGDLD